MRLTKSPSLTHRLENQISMAKSVRFSNFSHFQVSLWYFVLMFFGHVNSWVLLWDGFRWKPGTLGGVGICLGLIVDDICLKLLKETFCLFFCVHGLKPSYVSWTYAYAGLFLRTQAYSRGYVYMGASLRTQGPICIRGPWPAYMRWLADSLLCPFSLIF